MRSGMIFLIFALCLFTIGLIAQEPPLPLRPDPVSADQIHPFDRQLLLRVKRGAEWLILQQQADLLFSPGINAGLNRPLEPAHYLHQVTACSALARMGRLMGNARYTTTAREVLLSLVESTTKLDGKAPASRFTLLPESTLNRVGSAGVLMQAIHELMDPTEVRLIQGDELARFLRSCQGNDGMITIAKPNQIQMAAHVDDRSESYYRSLALLGMGKSLRNRSDAWKFEFLRGSLVSMYPVWEKSPDFQSIHGCVAGWSELAIQKEDRQAAGAVIAMADKLCDFQFRAEHGVKDAVGGFSAMTFNKKEMNSNPRCEDTSLALQALCDACRVARFYKDNARAEKYRQSCFAACGFLCRLQMTDENTIHYVEKFRPRLQGGFAMTPDDSTLRLCDTALATIAITAYLNDVAGVPLFTDSAPNR